MALCLSFLICKIGIILCISSYIAWVCDAQYPAINITSLKEVNLLHWPKAGMELHNSKLYQVLKIKGNKDGTEYIEYKFSEDDLM